MTEAEMKTLLAAIFVKKGMYAVEAETVASRMIDADLAGRHEFGCASIIAAVESIDLGDIDPRAIAMKNSETAATAWLNANEAMGQLSASQGVELAVSKAKEVGVGLIAISNSQNLGSTLVYANLIAQQGLLGICLTSEPGTKDLFDADGNLEGFGRQPTSFAIPASPKTIGFEFSSGDIRPLRHRMPTELIPTLGLLHVMATSGLAKGKAPSDKIHGPLRERFEHLLVAINPEMFGGTEGMQRVLEKSIAHLEKDGALAHDQAAITQEEFNPPAETLEAIQQLAVRLKVSV